MQSRINKTSICCIVFLDIIDYSKKTDSEQIDVKNKFNDLINLSLKDIAQDDRIILDTGDGAAIAYMGSPEDALFMAMSIRDGIIKDNTHSSTPLYVRFGINLGPVRVVSDINGHPNLIGDGINVAQRIMNFAKPNQILVSRSYYEVTSRLTQEISQMFDYSGVKQDKHVREHEIYSVRLLRDSASDEEQPAIPTNKLQSTEYLENSNIINWKYVALGLLTLAVLMISVKFFSAPSVPAIASDKPIAATSLSTTSKQNNEGLKSNNTDNLPPSETVKAESEISSQANTPDNQNTAKKQVEPSAKAVEPTAKKDKAKEKLSWKTFKDSVKQGQTHSCTQAEISLGQCK
jgi:hypothetical protein